MSIYMNEETQLNALWDISHLANHDCGIEYDLNGHLAMGTLYMLYGKQIRQNNIICSISKRPRGQCGRFDRWRAMEKLSQVY